MNPAQLLDHEFAEHLDVATRSRATLGEPFTALAAACVAALAGGGKIFFFGNGGSAADAQHLAAELVVRYRANRKALPALALTTDTSTLTACANDYSFDGIFSRQVEALCRPGDVAIGISTSGNSPNVLAGLAAARAIGATTIGFTGGTGGKMVELCDHCLVVPSTTVARIQEIHILAGHALCDVIEKQTCAAAAAV